MRFQNVNCTHEDFKGLNIIDQTNWIGLENKKIREISRKDSWSWSKLIWWIKYSEFDLQSFPILPEKL